MRRSSPTNCRSSTSASLLPSGPPSVPSNWSITSSPSTTVYLWAELPRISALVDKILTVHGDRHPELAEVQRLYEELRADLEPHLAREEQELFPMIRRLAATTGEPGSDTSALATQIDALAVEHETVGDLLDALNRATSGYTTPADGCASYSACYRALADLEADTHLHVHKENNLLFPAVQIEPALHR